MPISNLALDTGSAVIWGDVFSTESRITRDNNHFIMSIAITDYTGSINLKIFDEIGNKAKLEAISVGDTILIQGDISYDKYDRDMVMRPRNINTVKKNIITDDAPVKACRAASAHHHVSHGCRNPGRTVGIPCP